MPKVILMNPEIRFRVPRHVHQLATRRAEELGLTAQRGRTGGASELARGALYAFLGLSLPSELAQLASAEMERVEATRQEQTDLEPSLRVTVHHRVDFSYRRKRALETGERVPGRATTRFRFEHGKLPPFLVPYILLTEQGSPYATLNLEGALSPRRHVLGELVSAHQEATLEELAGALAAAKAKREQREKNDQSRRQALDRGTRILKEWAQKHGSELLKARLRGGFEWLSIASLEYSQSALAQMGCEDLIPIALAESLGPGQNAYRNLRLQDRPQLTTINLLEQWSVLADSALKLSAVLVDDSQGRSWEAVHFSFQLPTAERQHFLASLTPVE